MIRCTSKPDKHGDPIANLKQSHKQISERITDNSEYCNEHHEYLKKRNNMSTTN